MAWEIAPDRWATVFLPERAATKVRAALLQIAAAVRLTTPRPLHLPFRTGWLPRNAPAMSEAESWFTSQQDWGGIQRFGDTAHHRGLEILESRSGSLRPNTTAAGHPAQFYPARDVSRPAPPTGTHKPPLHIPAGLIVRLGADAWLTVTGDYSEADLIRIVEHMTFTPTPDDHSTWFDATQ